MLVSRELGHFFSFFVGQGHAHYSCDLFKMVILVKDWSTHSFLKMNIGQLCTFFALGLCPNIVTWLIAKTFQGQNCLDTFQHRVTTECNSSSFYEIPGLYKTHIVIVELYCHIKSSSSNFILLHYCVLKKLCCRNACWRNWKTSCTSPPSKLHPLKL